MSSSNSGYSSSYIEQFPTHDYAKYLVNQATELKPMIQCFASHYALVPVLNEVPAECANELMEIIVNILKVDNRPDLLPMLSHPACDYLVIRSKGQHIVPDIISNIGFLKGLKTLIFQLPSYTDIKFFADRRKSDEQNLTHLAYRIQHLNKLTVVHLPNICTTEILQSIAFHCPLLEDLDIHGSEVAPLAIRDLVKCKNLKYLNIDGIGSEVDLATHVAYVLQNLPNLRSIGKFDILSVMDHMTRPESLNDQCAEYKLESVSLRNREDKIDIVKLCAFFPLLQKIESEKAFGSDLGCLRLFSNLISITLTRENVRDLQRFFARAAGKLLDLNICGTENVGSLFQKCYFRKLWCLELRHCSGVDMNFISNSVPNLSKLVLEKCTACVGKIGVFANLHGLTLSGMCFSNEEITFLLESCNELLHLSLNSVYIRNNLGENRLFSNELFYELVRNDRMRNLSRVTLRGLGSTCRIVRYLLDNFASITNIDAFDHDSLPDAQELAVKLRIVNTIQREQIRNIIVRMACVPTLKTPRAIENNPHGSVPHF